MPSYLYLGSNPVVLGGFSNTGTSTTPWVRPTDWLAMPQTGSSGGFVGLLAVYSSSFSPVALSAVGAFTVNWGDGNTFNYSSSQIAYYTHSYNNLPSSSWSSGSNGMGNSGSIGYRQAIVQLTPSASALTSVIMSGKHYLLNGASAPAVNWLDVQIGGPDITSLSIGGNTLRYPLLERVNISNIPNSASFTSLATYFQNCGALQDVTIFDTVNVTNFSNLFYECRSLRNIPVLNTSKGTSFTQTFYNNYNLLTIPAWDFRSGSTFTSTFNGCASIRTVGNLTFTTASTCQGMFQNCTTLESVGDFDTSICTNFSAMFQSCQRLQQVGSYNTSKGATFSSMFQNCYTIKEVPLFDLQSGSNLSSMFAGASSLVTVPQFNTSTGSNLASMFSGCSSLEIVPLLNVTLATGSGAMASIFATCASLKVGALSGSQSTLNYTSCSLFAPELRQIFNYLVPTGSIACSITCSSNPGLLDLSPAEITSSVLSKNWTYKG